MLKLPKLLLVAVNVAVIAAIGVVRYLTGPELALSFFYLLPVAWTTWYLGRRAGMAMAFLCAGAWLAADLLMLPAFSHALVPVLNETLRLMVFLFISHILARLKAQVELNHSLAHTDVLTGIANRRGFLHAAHLELNKAKRLRYPVSMIYMDLDDFKRVNDRWGHQVGDRLLKSAAGVIVGSIRVIDIAARLGGDEFVVLLSAAGPEAARRVAEKLQQKLQALMDGSGWPVTLSLGVAAFEHIPDSVEELLSQTDALLYTAKRRGKNTCEMQVYSAPPAPGTV